MNKKQIPARLNFALAGHNLTKPFIWENVPGIVDFHENNICCDLDVRVTRAMALEKLEEEIQLTALTIKYSGSWYQADVSKCHFFIYFVPNAVNNPKGMEKRSLSVTFLKAMLSLTPHDTDSHFVMVFSGANPWPLEASVAYRGQTFHLNSPKNSDLLTVSSDGEFPENIWILISASFSLFQNGGIRHLEYHSVDEFQLYIQAPPPAGTPLCSDKNIFPMLWDWLANGDNFLRQRNTIEFFLAGSQNREGYLEFRLINLFVCMNSICGPEDCAFGKKIARCFGIDEADGYWLAYVRDNLVHEGKSIGQAISEAFIRFEKRQKPQGLTLVRYTSPVTKKKLYGDMIDLIMHYFMNEIGYTQPIGKLF